MAGYYVVLFNFPAGVSTPVERIAELFNLLKDWLRFTPEGWLVYTSLKPGEIREKLRKEFEKEDPSILIVPTDLSGWSIYSNSVSRDWLKKERDPSERGE